MPQCNISLHLQPLKFLWSLPMGVWKLGVGNESSWAIMNVLTQVCFDGIPPDWSQITEQNSESSLTTVRKAIWLARWWRALQDTLLCFCFLTSPLLPFLPVSSVITEWGEIRWECIQLQVFTLRCCLCLYNTPHVQVLASKCQEFKHLVTTYRFAFV